MPHPSPDASILNYLDDRERRRHYLCRILAPPMPPPPMTPQYLTILMTEREGGAIILCRISAPPSPPQTPEYLTILMTERGGAIILCRTLAPPNAPPPSPDALILNYHDDRERRRHYLCRILAPYINF